MKPNTTPRVDTPKTSLNQSKPQPVKFSVIEALDSIRTARAETEQRIKEVDQRLADLRRALGNIGVDLDVGLPRADEYEIGLDSGEEQTEVGESKWRTEPVEE
ncbi:hypothetical protein FRB90_009333, partial [Tulasnella sp. 427]